MSCHSRGDDPGVVMEKRRSWMASEASSRRDSGRSLQRSSPSLCDESIIEVPGANGWVEGQVDVG